MNPASELDVLLELVMVEARSIIGRFGEFLPFAAVLAGFDGAEPELVSPWDGPQVVPTREAVDFLRTDLRERVAHGQIRAAALATQRRRKTAVTVHLEHARLNQALVVTTPFTRRRLGGRPIAYGDPASEPAPPLFFVVL